MTSEYGYKPIAEAIMRLRDLEACTRPYGPGAERAIARSGELVAIADELEAVVTLLERWYVADPQESQRR
jgi:hypothetical protein